MRLILSILSLAVTCILAFNAPSWDTIKTGAQNLLKGSKKGSSTKNSASILIKGMLALFIFSSF